jgi:hypothetical protein
MLCDLLRSQLRLSCGLCGTQCFSRLLGFGYFICLNHFTGALTFFFDGILNALTGYLPGLCPCS